MILKEIKIKKEWTDYNSHLNVSYYTHIFIDLAAEVLLDLFKIGGQAAKKEKKTTFVVEMHTSYNKEIRVNEDVEIILTYLDHDKKRILYKLSMIDKQKNLISSIEVLSLYIDLNLRKVIEYEKEKTNIMDNFIKKNSSNFKSKDLIFINKLKKI